MDDAFEEEQKMRNWIKEIVGEWKSKPDYYVGLYNRIFVSLILCDFGVRYWA